MDERPVTKRRLSPAFVVWLIGVGAIVCIRYTDRLLERFGRGIPMLGFFSFLAWLLVIALSLYGLALFFRFLLRQLFWTVGRRLFLSYLLIGLLPFFLMTILLLTTAYMFAAVMTQAELRAERQATLGQLENWALEYVVTGKRPSGSLKSLEVYDSESAPGKLPEWLRSRSFSGLVARDGQWLLVASRLFDGDRSVVLAQPLNKEWTDTLFERYGMVVDMANARKQVNDRGINIDSSSGLQNVFTGNIGRKVIWGDFADLTDWNTGQSIADHSLFTLIANPPSNIFSYYFGSSAGDYLGILINIIMGIAFALMMMYAVAALFAAILIFSISRAVNRIEKGAHAVERGDFTYRIRMRRNNQLGAMAQSFDHMTESIASLLSTVAEKERLQSEIAIAAEIQRNLLPAAGPDYGGVSFSAHFEPTTSIGGDYYDVFRMGEQRLAVAIGDVSGHGLSTGLVMAMVKAAMTTLIEEGADATSLFRRLNQLVFRSTERRAFMTLAFTIFDLERGAIRHTNAGHLYPYLLRKDVPPQSIESTSLPLGVRHEINTRTVEIDLQEGDT
ncbi:MAG TPA: SpoIIE family protein phosphatase, partial [Thermoanaerobaculia bacterium]|nr:SpoIIE family protein phosphatase [Thermoanaerobaculia bacterium]